MATICPKCGASIRYRHKGYRKNGSPIMKAVTLLGNPHACPRSGPIAAALDQGKKPYAMLRERMEAAGKRRVERNEQKGLTAKEDS